MDDNRSTISGRFRDYFRKTDEGQDDSSCNQSDNIEDDPNDEDVRRPILIVPESDDEDYGNYDYDYDEEDGDVEDTGEPFSWFEYSIFLLLGVVMLWAW